jgi:hypothetical protein
MAARVRRSAEHAGRIERGAETNFTDNLHDWAQFARRLQCRVPYDPNPLSGSMARCENNWRSGFHLSAGLPIAEIRQVTSFIRSAPNYDRTQQGRMRAEGVDGLLEPVTRGDALFEEETRSSLKHFTPLR